MVFSFLALTLMGGSTSAVKADNSDDDNIRTALNLNDNGAVLARGAKVVSVSAPDTINATLSWGKANINFVVKTDASTRFILRQDGRASFSDIAPGNLITFEGRLITTESALTVKAKIVRNLSIRKLSMNLSGTIKNINQEAKTFVMDAKDKDKDKGDVTVMVSDSTEIKKQNSVIKFSDLKTGDIVSVNGLFNSDEKKLQARKITVSFSNRTVFQNAVLKSLAGTSLPTSAVVRFGKLDYTVNLAADTAIVNSRFLKAKLSDFKAGDHLRIYGSADGTTITATIAMDLNLK